MILDVIVEKSDDGYTAEIPSLKGCETWASNEDEVLAKISELARYYLKLPASRKLTLDKARGTFKRSVYKLILPKE